MVLVSLQSTQIQIDDGQLITKNLPVFSYKSISVGFHSRSCNTNIGLYDTTRRVIDVVDLFLAAEKEGFARMM